MVSARGFCNVEGYAAENNELDLKLGKDPGRSVSKPNFVLGRRRVADVTTTAQQGLGYTAEVEVLVAAGECESISLYVVGQGTRRKDCSGSLVIHAIF